MTVYPKTAIVAVAIVSGLFFATASIADSSSSQREKQTTGVTPDKTSTSAGEANREGTGEGRATPAERTPTKGDGH